MRELHAGLLLMQGLPIVVGLMFALWIAYHVRVAVKELRAIRENLERLNYYFEAAPVEHVTAPQDEHAP